MVRPTMSSSPLAERWQPTISSCGRFLIGSADAVLGAEGVETGERLAGAPLLTARVAVQVRLPVADLERAAEHTVTLAWHEHTGARARDLTRPSPSADTELSVWGSPNGNVQISQRSVDGHRRRIDPRGQRARALADLLEQGHDNPFRPAHVGHPHAVLVLADAADEPVPVHSQLTDDRLEAADLE